MKKLFYLFLLICAIAWIGLIHDVQKAQAQTLTFVALSSQSGAPGGTCGGVNFQNLDTATGNIYTCPNGVGTSWVLAAAQNSLFDVISKTATYNVSASDFQYCRTIEVSSGTFTITLLSSAPTNGGCIQVINFGSGVITISPNGLNMNGSSSSVTIAAGSASSATGINVFSDGGNYVAQTYSQTGQVIPGTCAASSQAGSSPAAQINACVTALPNGGTIDATGFPCYIGSNAQLWDQGVVLGFTGAGTVNGKGHTLLIKSCTTWNVTISDGQTVPLTIHPQSYIFSTDEGVNSGNGFVVASSGNFPELIAANCDYCWLKISAISRSGTTVTVTTSVSGPTLSAKPVLVYGVTDAADFANGIKSMTGSGTSYTYTEAGSATSSSGGAAGFGYTGIHTAINIVGVNALIGSSPTMLYGIHVYAPLQGTLIRGINVGCPANSVGGGVGLEIDGDGTSVGPLDIQDDTVDCASSTLSTPLEITTRGAGGEMGGVNVIGGLYAHEGVGEPDIRIADDGGNYQNLGVSLYNVSMEDNSATAQGLLIHNTVSTAVYSLQCGSATGNGATCVSITGSSMGPVELDNIFQTGAYTNTISDTSNGHSVSLPGLRVSHYAYGGGQQKAQEWCWGNNGNTNNGQVLCMDISGIGTAVNQQPQTGGNFGKTTASLQTWKSIPIYASQILSFHCEGVWQGSTTAATLGLAVTTPASPTNIQAWTKIDTTATNTSTSGPITATATAFVGGVPNASSTSYPFLLYGTVENGANAGTLAIQAENGAASGTMNIMRGSYCYFYHQ
jgi:hypothetical protein